MSVFTQGCIHNCKGCHNPESHDPNGGKLYDTDKIIKLASENPLYDGVTLTGGDPFYQPEACAEIAEGVKKLGLNVWTFTGYTWEQLTDSKKRILCGFDELPTFWLTASLKWIKNLWNSDLKEAQIKEPLMYLQVLNRER